MKELRISVAKNGFVVTERCPSPMGVADINPHVFESPETLAVFIKNWGRDNSKVQAGYNPEPTQRIKVTTTGNLSKPKGVWLQHDGGECPVPVVANVMVSLRGVVDQEGSRGKAAIWDWKHYGKSSDITEYMIVE